MKSAIYFLFFLSGLPLQAQLTTFYVRPETIDAGYATAQDSHYVALNPSATSNGKLLVFFPGTGALTKHYTLFPQLAANMGYHCVSIAYPNGYPTVAQSCAGSSDVDCYRHIREEVCYGNDVSPDVSVDAFNSIHQRLIGLLDYLDTEYPAQGWNTFLTGGQPAWSLIAVSGHSQGSGHALYLAKTNSCERLIMFAGADDYSNYYSAAANWISSAGLTNSGRYFSFLHLHDDVWDYAKQYEVVKSISMTNYGDDSTLVDYASAPYSNSHCLYTDLAPLYPGVYSAEHNGMVVDFYTPKIAGTPVYEPVWTYMLSTTVIDGLLNGKTEETSLQLFPNPAQDQVTLMSSVFLYAETVQLLNLYGEALMEETINGNSLALNTTVLKPGVYMLRVKNEYVKLVKE